MDRRGWLLLTKVAVEYEQQQEDYLEASLASF